ADRLHRLRKAGSTQGVRRLPTTFRSRIGSLGGADAESAHELVDQLARLGVEVLELDPHSGRLLAIASGGAHDTAHNRDRLRATRDAELERYRGAGLRRSLRLHEHSAFVDVARELGEQLVDGLVVDADHEFDAVRAPALTARFLAIVADAMHAGLHG